MLNFRFSEQEAAELVLHKDAIGWCQYEGEKPEHGYLVLTELHDGRISAVDRTVWQALHNPLIRTN